LPLERGWLFAQGESPVSHSNGWIFKDYIANPFPVHCYFLKIGLENTKITPNIQNAHASCKNLLEPPAKTAESGDDLQPTPRALGLYNQQVVAHRQL